MIIKYINHKNIDKIKWDTCIDNSVNGLIYGKTFFLDNMAANWDGIVWGDYEAVMALTWRSKWGIRYLYQPAFLQQGGIFYKNTLSEKTIQLFFDVLFKHFKFAEITANYLNFPNIIPLNAAIKNRINFIIDLNQHYSVLQDGYSFSCKRNLKKIEKIGLRYHSSDDFLEMVELYKNLYKERLLYFSNSDYENIKKVCKELSNSNNLIIRQIYDKKNELLCAVILLKYNKRLYNIMNCVCPIGKKLKANYYLYDCLFREFSGQSLVFDFEGSDITGIAEFYMKFNPLNQPYPFIKYNNLNYILKIFKR